MLKILCGFFFHCNLINKTLLVSCRIPINKKIRSQTLDCRISLVIVTLDPFASDTCFTVKSPTNLTSVIVGNHTEDCKKQGFGNYEYVVFFEISIIIEEPYQYDKNVDVYLSSKETYRNCVFIFFSLQQVSCNCHCITPKI